MSQGQKERLSIKAPQLWIKILFFITKQSSAICFYPSPAGSLYERPPFPTVGEGRSYHLASFPRKREPRKILKQTFPGSRILTKTSAHFRSLCFCKFRDDAEGCGRGRNSKRVSGSYPKLKFKAVHSIICLFHLLISSPLMATQCTLSCPHGRIGFKVELAQTSQERAQGLMNRKTLEEDEGMLFMSSEPYTATMWMKNTPLSLDMLFINQEGEIVAIEENTTPYSLKLIGPIEGITQVLEVKGGAVKKNGVSKACNVRLDL